MAWRYRDRITKVLTSSANYSRSRSQGGTKFERFSDATWNVKGRAKPSTSKSPAKSGQKSSVKPSGEKVSGSLLKTPPSTPMQWEQMMGARLKKLSKRKRAEFYQEEYDGPEYETGVDY